MAWTDAKTAAAEWVQKHLPVDLRRHFVQLVKFEDEASARFFDVEAGYTWHLMRTSAIARAARKRGAKITYVTAEPEKYREWLGTQGKPDNDAARLSYLQSLHMIFKDQ